MARPVAAAFALYIRPVHPTLPARTYPLGAGGPYNHSPWPNNSTISRTPLPSSTWPPPPNWAPHAPYNGTNFSLPYSGHPVPSYVNIPPPSHYRPPPTQPSVLLNPGEYVWNPSLGPIGDPPPPNAPAGSPGPPNALDEFHAAVEKFGEGWQALAEEKEHLQKSQAAMFAAEKITRSQKDIETNPDPTLLQKRLIDTVEDERLQSVGLENPARIHKGRSTPSVFPISSLKRRKLEEDPSHQLRETAELMVAGVRESVGALAEGLRQSAEAVVVGNREPIGRIEALEKSNSDIHDAIERNNKAIDDLSARLTRVEEGVKTLLEFLTKKSDDVDKSQ